MPLGSLWARLLAAQIVVLVVTGATLVIVSEYVAPSLFDERLQSMNEMMADTSMMGGNQPGFLTPGVEDGISSAFDSSLRRALIISMSIAGVAAVAVSGFSTRRILAPLAAVRQTTRRLAAGSYGERIDPPAETELAALAADVNALADSLESTEQRRIRLISEIAHELRTPLTTIEGYLEGMLDGVFEPSDEILAASSRELRRLNRLADDLSEVSRAEEGNQPLVKDDVDLSELVRTVGDNLRRQFEAKGVTFSVGSMQPIYVEADRDRLSQVLTNIIGNALAYTESGGEVGVVVATDGTEALVEVTDTGRGLSPEETTAVFERFYRSDHASPGGSGIGLTIARAIARRHGGDVTASSSGRGHGSAFTLRLPRH